MPYQVTQTDGASSLAATTTYGYDPVGNVVWVDGPLAGSDDRIYKTYDANRRIICEVGADPDGTGTLVRAMVRHTYDGAGRETKTEQGTGTGTTSCLSTNMAVASFTRMIMTPSAAWPRQNWCCHDLRGKIDEDLAFRGCRNRFMPDRPDSPCGIGRDGD